VSESRTPYVTAGGEELSPDQVWQAAKGELQLQMTKATFDTWINRARFSIGEGGTFTVEALSDYARDWLENRLAAMIRRTLASLTNRPPDEIQLRFVVQAQPQQEAWDLSGESPIEDEQPETRIVVRDRRKPRQFSIENVVFDEWRPIIGAIGYDLYSFYVRMSNRDLGEKAWPAYSLIQAHLSIGRSSISEYNHLLAWCGLLHIEPGNHRKSNTYYILDPQPVTPEALAILRETIEREWSLERHERPCRQATLKRIDDWLPLQARWAARNQREATICIVRQPPRSPAQEGDGGGLAEVLSSLGVRSTDVERLIATYPAADVEEAIERTRTRVQQSDDPLRKPGAYLCSLLDEGYVK